MHDRPPDKPEPPHADAADQNRGPVDQGPSPSQGEGREGVDQPSPANASSTSQGEGVAPAEGYNPANEELRERIITAIQGVYDPEIPVNVYDLGLIYQVNVNAETGRVTVLMTLTTPNCPEAQVLPGHVRNAAESIVGVKEADVQVIWDPPWTPDRMSDEARMELGMF